MLINYFISAFILGIIVAIPPGAVTVIACQRALQYGFKNSLIFSAGSSITDIFYISLVYLGLTGFILNSKYKLALWIICGILLIAVGILTAISIRGKSIVNNKQAAIQSNPLVTFFSGIIITLTNPMTIIGWVAVAGNFFIMWRSKFNESGNYPVLTVIVIMTGVLIWFLPIVFLVSRLKKIINIKFQNYLIVFSGICLIIFGCISLLTGFTMN
jgi:threonine/homoserine/homoserine lactone efflux protein